MGGGEVIWASGMGKGQNTVENVVGVGGGGSFSAIS